MRFLEQFYRPQDFSQRGQPICVVVEGSTIYIEAVFRYNRAALKPWDIDGMSQADILEAAIIRKWSGSYRLRSHRYRGYIKTAVRVRIKRQIIPDSPVHIIMDPLGRYRQRAVPIRIKNLRFMPAHVISPWYRRFWGFLRTGQWESIGTNWSRRNPGIMVMPPCSSRAIPWFERMAAHEAGHLFGLGDAYGAIYRYYYAAPYTSKYMMNSNRRVQPREIVMLLEAHIKNKMQFFPRKWDSSIFIRGFKRDIERRTKELDRKKRRKKAARKRKSTPGE